VPDPHLTFRHNAGAATSDRCWNRRFDSASCRQIGSISCVRIGSRAACTDETGADSHRSNPRYRECRRARTLRVFIQSARLNCRYSGTAGTSTLMSYPPRVFPSSMRLGKSGAVATRAHPTISFVRAKPHENSDISGLIADLQSCRFAYFRVARSASSQQRV
jgi:hypothetical protein